MYQMLKTLDARFDNFCKCLYGFLQNACVVLAGLLLIFTLAGVILRYLFPNLAGWSGVEMPSLLLMWVTSIGIPLAVGAGSHLCVDLLAQFLKGAVKLVHSLIVNIVSIAFYIIFLFVMWNFCHDNLTAISPMLGVPLIWVYISAIIGALFSLVFLVSRLLSDIVALVQFGKGTKPQNSDQSGVISC